MSKEKPEAKDRLGEDIENSVGNNFAIDIDDTSSISNTPDTRDC